MTDAPKIDHAPGLRWRKRKHDFVAIWQARTDIARAGYLPKWIPLWQGIEPNDMERAMISDRCNSHQADMLVWAKGGLPSVQTYDGTVGSLIACFLTDPDSIFAKKRYSTRRTYDYSCRRIEALYGHGRLADINARMLLRWHETWVGDEGHVTLAQRLMTMAQILFKFGATILEDPECERLLGVKNNMRFPAAKPRGQVITAEQATAIRAKAHEMGHPAIALAQAIQFDLGLRQKDVIGEWEPLSERTLSDIQVGQLKWVRGIRWSEIDGLILRHETSKRGKFITRDLRLAPMVMEEFTRQYPDGLPTEGALIQNEAMLPYAGSRFRKIWREIATAVGVPPEVYNMDSRAGAITEAMMAGVEPEHVRQFATHSNLQTTMGYSRDNTGHADVVMIRRKESRDKK